MKTKHSKYEPIKLISDRSNEREINPWLSQKTPYENVMNNC